MAPLAGVTSFEGFQETIAKLLEDERTRAILSELSKTAALIDVDYLENLDDVYRIVVKRVKEVHGIDVPFEEVKSIAETMSKVYAIADHTRALVFMLGDGVVPSNMREGYFARPSMIAADVRTIKELYAEKGYSGGGMAFPGEEGSAEDIHPRHRRSRRHRGPHRTSRSLPRPRSSRCMRHSSRPSTQRRPQRHRGRRC